MANERFKFPIVTEKRYAQYPRRYTNEYYVDSREKLPICKGRCATLVSARTRAVRSIDLGYCTTVRVFDHMKGEYLLTYKVSDSGIARHDGFVR